MRLDQAQREAISTLATTILDALQRVSDAAQQALADVHASDPERILAVTTNTMVHGPSATVQRLQMSEAEARMVLGKLASEPFVARVSVAWDDKPGVAETIYVARMSPGGIGEVIRDARIVSYRAAFGRLAEVEAGDAIALETPGGVRRAVVQERVRLRPSRSDGSWDGLDDSLEFEHWSLALASLTRFLTDVAPGVPTDEQIPDIVGALLRQGAEAQLVLDRARRRVVERMSLRDQPILDRFQGEVFRMPVDRRLVLLGPPGTGKTTTLIRRVAQKRTLESLADGEVEALERAGVRETLSESTWAMFSPTELLKLYLREAFNREAVAASSENLRTWESQRLQLARNTLGILRSANGGRFQLDGSANPLINYSSGGTVKLFEAFSAEMEQSLLFRLGASVEEIRSSNDAELKRQTDEVIGRLGPSHPPTFSHLGRILQRGAALQPVLKRLADEVDEQLRRIANRLVFRSAAVLDDIAANLAQLDTDDRGEDDEEEDSDETTGAEHRPQTPEGRQQSAADLLITALRFKARSLAGGRARVSGRAGRVLALIGDRISTDEELIGVGGTIATLIRARALVRAPRQIVMGAPLAYSRFRSRSIRDGAFFRPEAVEITRQGKLCPDEVDVIILAMLRNARRLLEDGRLAFLSADTQEWLENIRREYLTQVFVDEATDFSAVQLACTLELSHPRLHSWFACGDFNQRITANGVSAVEDFQWLGRGVGKDIDLKQVTIGYRQSRRLRELVSALSREGGSQQLDSPDWVQEPDVPPLLAEGCSSGNLIDWLASRITDIEKSVGQLPSIAIFVNGEDYIDPLVSDLRRALAGQNIQVVGCHDGRDVGDELEVRVFNVRHIKGLEFEAVFFVAIDRLASQLPDLFDRFFYVGASRAATYLGVTCEERLPESLAPVRDHFSSGNWAP